MSKVENLSNILKQRIKNFESKTKISEEGNVLTVQDGIATISGLSNVASGEMLEFPGGLLAMVLNLEEDYVGAILLGSYSHIKENDVVKRTGKIVEVPVGDELLGRIVDPLGVAVDGAGEIKTSATMKLERTAPGIMTRKSVHQPVQTGILAIDSMIPIGKGQRELIIGDRKTGKTAIGIDTIINQKGKNVKCVYVSIGQKNSSLATTVEKLKEHGAMEYTTIVEANASSADAIQFIAPYAGMAIAEGWLENGEDVLIIFDDLSKHAVAYRTVSLLLRRPPGREAYPGDVFYLHSRLLERACKLNDENGGGSITALPIVETQAGDISAYIPTNVISITDGQMFLMTDMFNAGQRPAVDPGLSVSRVGSAAQTKLIKKLSGSLKLGLANYNEMKAFAEFSSDLDANTKAIIDNGQVIMELLKQKQYSPYSIGQQAVLLYIMDNKLLKDLDIKKISDFKEYLVAAFETDAKLIKIIQTLVDEEEMNEKVEKELQKVLDILIKKFK